MTAGWMIVALALAAPQEVTVRISRTTLKYKPEKFEAVVTEDAQNSGERYSVQRIEFPSPVKSGAAKNDTVVAWLFSPKIVKADGAVVIAPPWRVAAGKERQLAVALAEREFHALVVTLPYQGDRTPDGVTSEDNTLSSNLDRTESVLVQAAQDLQRAAEWLALEKKAPRDKIGLFGLSFGAAAASLAWSVSGDFKTASLALCPGQMSDFFWNDSLVMGFIKKELGPGGNSLEKIRKRTAKMDPVAYARGGGKTAVQIIASNEDDIVPKASSEALGKAYGGAAITWITGGHPVAAQEFDLKIVTGHFEKTMRK